MQTLILVVILFIAIMSVAGKPSENEEQNAKFNDMEEQLDLKELSDAVERVLGDMEEIIGENQAAKDAYANTKREEACVVDDIWTAEKCQQLKDIGYCFTRIHKKRLEKNCKKTCRYCQPHAYAFITKTGKLPGADNQLGSIFIRFNTNKGCMEIKGVISQLTPGRHGFHVHQNGNLDGGCKSAGDHFNPNSASHGSPFGGSRHVGDLGNIEANEEGKATVDVCVPLIHTEGYDSVIGRSVVVHARGDDFGVNSNNVNSLKMGDSGRRVACGAITKSDGQFPCCNK